MNNYKTSNKEVKRDSTANSTTMCVKLNVLPPQAKEIYLAIQTWHYKNYRPPRKAFLADFRL